MSSKRICFFFIGFAIATQASANDGTFDPPNGYVFDAAHQHPTDLVVMLDDQSVSMISGGLIGSYLQIGSTSTFDMDGGTVGSYIRVQDSGTLNLNGGTAQSYIDSENSSIINIHGGSFADLRVNFGGTINIYGTNLLRNSFTLTGTLEDGETLNASFHHTFGAQGQLNLITVPEPSTFILMAIGVGAVAFHRARRQSQSNCQ